MNDELASRYRRDVEVCDKLLRRVADATPPRYEEIHTVRRARTMAKRRLASVLEIEATLRSQADAA